MEIHTYISLPIMKIYSYKHQLLWLVEYVKLPYLSFQSFWLPSYYRKFSLLNQTEEHS